MQLLMSSRLMAQSIGSRGAAGKQRLFASRATAKAARGNSCKCNAFFGKLAKSIKDIGGGGAGSIEEDELYHTPETRACYTVEDVKEYYTITGIYAVQTNYDLFDTMVATGADPVDLILLMACSEGDDGKVEECLKAGAHPDFVGHDGKSAIEVAEKEEIKEMLQAAIAARTAGN